MTPAVHNLVSGHKNLLAFSGGTDSSALAHMLHNEYKIHFDIAIVNYNTRETSKEEAEYAKHLADKFGCMCFVLETELPESKLESTARKIRYDFFEDLIQKYDYETLITGHNLNDRMEWFLMQMTRGAGLKEMYGMEEISEKVISFSEKKYNIVRPLFKVNKGRIMNYLEKEGINFFQDISNQDTKYTRNKFRHEICNQLVEEFSEGIKKSFDYLEKDVDSLGIETTLLEQDNELKIYKISETSAIRSTDLILKQFGYLMSSAQRLELEKNKFIVFSLNTLDYVASINYDKLYLTPYIKADMPKDFKDNMRKNKIPVKNRPYLYKINKTFETTSKEPSND